MFRVITIDGPAASGKTSVSRQLARKLAWPWVSTGSFYRGLAYVAYQKGISFDDEAALGALTVSPDWRVELADECTMVFFHEKDVTHDVHNEKVGSLASKISQFPEVRKKLLTAQRDCAVSGSLVAEGRDCGSIVFPNADLKIFLTASQENRAQRRAQEQGLDLKVTQEEQAQRDARDSQRKVAPMQIPQDAQVIDTSELSLEEVTEQVFKMAEELCLF